LNRPRKVHSERGTQLEVLNEYQVADAVAVGGNAVVVLVVDDMTLRYEVGQEKW
jgi:serine acetyltransferase